MARLEEDINPKILGLARQRAGFSLEDAAKKAGVKASKLADMETGKSRPTRNQLYKIAKSYWYPLAAFYASQPPLPTRSGVDFRSPNIECSDREKGRLNALIRSVYARQDMIKVILEEDEDTPNRDFVGSIDAGDYNNISETVEAIRNTLNVRSDTRLKFKDLIIRAEKQGIFVLLANDLGDNRTRISESIFRGFAIADKIAPFIVINPSDAETAKSFTLIHELAHIFIGSSGISAEPSIDIPQTRTSKIERFCNDVASYFLLPQHYIDNTEAINDIEKALGIIERIAEKRKVSRLMVAYRFFRANIISKDLYQELSATYLENWEEVKKRKKEKENKGKKVKINPNVTKKYRLGTLLVSFVERSLNAQELTYTKAAHLLGVNAASVRVLIEATNKRKNK